MTVFYLTLVLFLLMLTGFAARRLNIVDGGFAKNLSSFLFNIAYPTLVIDSMQFSFSKDSFFKASRLVAISIAVLVVSWAVARLMNTLFKSEQASCGVVTFSIMYSNFTFMAFPIIENLYGKDMLFYVAIFTAVMRIAYSTHGVNAIAGSMKQKSGIGIKSVLNPPVVAIIIGLVIYFFSLKLPYSLEMAIDMLAKTVSPMGMIVAGLILAEYRIKDIFSEYRVYLISLLRLVVIPLLVLAFVILLGLSDTERRIAVVVSAMPAASVGVIIAARYGADKKLAAEAAFVSTLFSTLTVPLISLLI